MGDIETIQNGGTTEFNSNIQVIMRLHELINRANFYSGGNTINDLQSWHSILLTIDRELYPLMNKKETEKILLLRKRAAVPFLPRPDNSFIRLQKLELDDYERELRIIMYSKGLGVKAGMKASEAIMR